MALFPAIAKFSVQFSDGKCGCKRTENSQQAEHMSGAAVLYMRTGVCEEPKIQGSEYKTSDGNKNFLLGV